MTSFKDLGLSKTYVNAVERLGYTSPTAIQEQAIPPVLEGHDLIATAETGTGKTAAFCLPCLDILSDKKTKKPSLLILSPTRELVGQIADFCKQVTKNTPHHVCAVVGGTPYGPQIKRLKQGASVLVATPGRLIDLINKHAVDLSEVSILVLDEADRMLDMGFLPDVRRVMDLCPDDRQNLLFSATMDKKNLQPIINRLYEPVKVEIARKGNPAATIDQYAIETKIALKPHLLISLLKEKGSQRVIVFTRTKRKADICVRRLQQAGFNADSIHSDKSQGRRKKVLSAFHRSDIDILVATDVLARGIDVSEVSYVVNYDLPDQPEDYIHRIGRTGRAGAKGFSVSFVTPDTRSNLKAIQKLMGKKIPPLTLKDFDEEALLAEEMRKDQLRYDRRDKELAQAAKEFTKKKSRKKRTSQKKAYVSAEDQHEKSSKKNAPKSFNERNKKPSKKKSYKSSGNDTRKPSGKRSYKAVGNKSKSTNRKPKNASRRSDNRPGRAYRAETKMSAVG